MRFGSALLMRLALAVVLFACAGPAEPPPSASAGSTEGDEPGATRASREAAHAGGTPEAEAPAASPPRALWILVALGAVERAEDGLGAVVSSTDAVAIDLDAHRFPPRALDPVLEVGALRFRHYVHPEAGVLRFVLADGSVLERGDPIAIQYGDDIRSRVVLAAGTLPAGEPPIGPGTVAP